MKTIEYLNQRQVAEKVRKSSETIARWRDQGRIPKPDAYVGGTQGMWLEKTIDEWIKRRKVGEKKIREAMERIGEGKP